MAKQGPRVGEIPKQIIPLPNPPSDAGSAIYMSDGSITASVMMIPGDSSVHTDAYDTATVDLEKQQQEQYKDPQQHTFPSSSPPHSPSRPPSVYKPHRYSGTTTTKRGNTIHFGTGEDSMPSTKKKVTVMTPEETTPKGKQQHNDQSTISTSKRSTEDFSNHANGTKRANANRTKKKNWCGCSPTVAYALFGIAITATIVAVGINVLIYFDGQDNNLPTEDVTTTIDFHPPSTIPPSDNFNSSAHPPSSSPNTAPTLENEEETDVATIITGIVTNQFRVDLPDDNPYASVNLAVDWLIEEVRTIRQQQGSINNNSTTSTTQVYNTMEKFSQRFALLVMRYALAETTSPTSSSIDTAVSKEFQSFPQLGVDECDWWGIICDSDGMTTEIHFSNANLSGTIPAEIQFFQMLQVLDLSNNRLQGSLPDELYELKQMRKVYLYQNQLSGTLSPWIGQWDDLEVLHLSSNKIRGPIPPQLQSVDERIRPLSTFSVSYQKRTNCPLCFSSCLCFSCGS